MLWGIRVWNYRVPLTVYGLRESSMYDLATALLHYFCSGCLSFLPPSHTLHGIKQGLLYQLNDTLSKLCGELHSAPACLWAVSKLIA